MHLGTLNFPWGGGDKIMDSYKSLSEIHKEELALEQQAINDPIGYLIGRDRRYAELDRMLKMGMLIIHG